MLDDPPQRFTKGPGSANPSAFTRASSATKPASAMLAPPAPVPTAAAVANGPAMHHLDASERVMAERLRYLRSADTRFTSFSLLLGVFATLAFQLLEKRPLVWLWGGAFFGITLCRLVASLAMRGRLAESSGRAWLRLWLPLLTASATLWGVGPLLFLPRSDGAVGVVTVIWLVSAGMATPFIANSRMAIYVWFLPALLPLVVALMVAGGDVALLLGLFAAAMLVVHLRLALEQNELLTQALHARFRNDDLVGQLQAQMNLAERADLNKTRFLASAAHDLRQPLHALGLFCAALDQRLGDIPEKPLVRSMMRSIDAMETSFSAILDISRLDAGAVEATPQAFPVRDLFRRLYLQFNGDAELRGINLRFRAYQRLVVSDPQLLERILANLLQNALRYTRTGGVLVAARRHGEAVSLEVWDTGVGIPEDQMQSIFEEFYQVENSERDRTKGLGIGLAIAKRLCRLLEHPLEVRSVPGRGSVFRVVVPSTMQGAPDSAQLGADTLPPRLQRQATVLLIDDEQTIRDAVGALLRPQQIELLTAASIGEAVKAAAHRVDQIDLILSDWRLRGQEDGITAVREVRRACGESTPAVLLTGDTSTALLKLAHENGLLIMHKPLKPADLIRLIEKLAR